MHEGRVEGARLGIDRPTATTTGIRDQEIDATLFLDDLGDHPVDRLAICDIDLDPESGAAHRLDFGERAFGGHAARLGVEFLICAQIEVSDRDLRAQSGESLQAAFFMPEAENEGVAPDW